jgi:ribosomal protein L37AE/L43A
MKNFVRKKEDFVCQVCGVKVKGTGYTNHCPNCLFSLHVDELVPGDRISNCKGLMEPIRAEIKDGEYVLIHKCQKCKKVIKNKTLENDNFEEVIKLI